MSLAVEQFTQVIKSYGGIDEQKVDFEKPERKITEHISHLCLKKPACKKNGQKSGQCPYGGEGGLPQFINFSLILPGPQITWKWTIHTDKLTTKCHICLHT